LEVCHEWRIKPSDFWLDWAEEDQAYAIAYIQAKAKIQAWEQQVHEDEMERQKRKSGRGSSRR
jgi:hypothetical protein